MIRPLLETETDARIEAATAWCLKLADGALAPAEQQAFEAWLEADADNRRALEDTVGVWSAVGELSVTPRILGLRRDALTGFERANRRRWRPIDHRWRGAAIAACLALAIGGGVAWKTLTPTLYQTAVGERRIVVLSDGSKLTLDAATRVSVLYRAHNRTLRLETGRANFEVAHDPQRPFTVAAGDKLVRATGTEFSVELVRDEVQVVLYQGHVAVTTLKGAAPVRLAGSAGDPGGVVEADEVLTPGHELVAPLTSASGQVVATDLVRAQAWEGGQLVFVGEPLASAIERVNRYADRKVSIGDAAAAAVRVDGVFTAGDTDAFVEAVTELFPVRVRDTAEGKVLVSRQ